MNKFNVITILLISKLCFSQVYVPFPNDTATWVNNTNCWSPCDPSSNHQPKQVVQRGDSLENGILYHKIYSVTSSSSSFFCFSRESNKKIYCKYPLGTIFGDDTTEYVLYDFNLNVGDTFTVKTPTNGATQLPTTAKIKLDSISTMYVTAANKVCTSYMFSNVSSGFPLNLNIIWYEGVAANQGFLYNLAFASWPITTPSSFPYMYDLNCFYRSNSLIYDPNCLATSINKTEKENANISIYPNPINSILNIVGEQNQFQNSTIEITNCFGEIVFNELFANQIDLSSLSSGMYFLTIKDKENIKTVKLIKE